jgi:hypothetical protein
MCRDKTPHGRPAGEVRQAVLQAAEQVAGEQGASLRELATAARVGLAAARWTVRNLKAAGALHQVGERREAHRNRPVHLYAVASPARINDFSGLEQVW